MVMETKLFLAIEIISDLAIVIVLFGLYYMVKRNEERLDLIEEYFLE